MKRKYLKKILSRIRNFVITNYQKINNDNFVLGECVYNYKCHLNSVQKVKENKANKVFACITIQKNNNEAIVVHFINQLADGTYSDHTWGYLYKLYDY